MDRAEPREITESFRLERVLKSSRSAIVFRAIAPDTGVNVAIKLIPPAAGGLETDRERFLTAMGVLESAAPATFPALLDYGFSPDGSAFMVMELVDGERLDSLTDPHPDRVLRLALGVLDGIRVLAQNGLSHGNLAPENLLVSGPPDAERVVTLGFGTAAFHGGLAGLGAASLGEGPAQFAAPEQLDSATAPTADWRSDLYALAASTCALLRAEIAPADAPAPSVLLPALVRARLVDPVTLQVVLQQCLRQEPAERPTSLEEVRRALHVALSGTPAEPERPGEPATVPLVLDHAAATGPEPAVIEGLTAPTTPPVETGGPAGAPVEAVAQLPPTHEAFAEGATPPTPEAESPAPPRAEKLKTGPVPAQRMAELPTAAFSVRFEEPPTEAVPVSPPEPLPVAAVTPPLVPEVVAEPAAPPPAEPPAEEAAAAPSQPAQAKPKAAVPGKRSLLPWALGIAAVVVIASGAGWLWLQRQQTARPVARPVTTAAPRPTAPSPQPSQVSGASEQLLKAEAAVALGDLAAAGAALDQITPEDVVGLSQAEQERYTTIRAAYAAARRQALTKAMQRALASGNLRALGDAVRDVSKEEESSFKRDADFSASLEEGRRALNLQAAMQRAQRQGDQGQALQSASVLLGIAPNYAPAAEARDKAAAALEREADTLAGRGSFDQALARLDAVQRGWPARPGLQARLERIRAEQEADRKFAAQMTQAQQAGDQNLPEKGLEILKSLPADARNVQRVQQLRDRLAQQLAQLDAQPPTVALTPGLKLEYKKGEPATVAFKIEDDHGVKSAQLFARVEGSGKFVELPFRHVSGPDWSVEISFAFHQNQTVEFYAVAADHSGHTTMLGSPQQPLKLKRKKNIFGF